MDLSAFDYELPHDLVAQYPLPERDASRLLVLPRGGGPPDHRAVRDLPRLVRPGDLLVVNDARVIPARLYGRKRDTGGKVELLLLEPRGGADWLALGQSSKPLRPGARVALAEADAEVEVVDVRGGGELLVRLPAQGEAVWDLLDRAGEMPLPPYIERPADQSDRDRYQTVFARERGAVAAPTAGLHFTDALLAALTEAGASMAVVTLHVGPGTFLPVRVQRVEEHRMHRERYFVPEATARAHAETRAAGGRVIAVGTTALRTLEAASPAGALEPGPGTTDLFIFPGYSFRAVDGLFTNFHLPKSTLLMLVAAFAGLERVLAAYREAVSRRYRLFSYGDAMLIA